MKPRMLLSLCAIGMLACRAPHRENGIHADAAPPARPDGVEINKDAALRIAKDLFSKEQSSALSLYEISIEDNPQIGRWVVFFFGGSLNSLTIVLVDKKTGKASIHGT